jgi:hypothetical protein
MSAQAIQSLAGSNLLLLEVGANPFEPDSWPNATERETNQLLHSSQDRFQRLNPRYDGEIARIEAQGTGWLHSPLSGNRSRISHKSIHIRLKQQHGLHPASA